MRSKPTIRSTIGAAILAAATVAPALPLSAQEPDFKPQITARKALMQLYAFNIGQLGAMAKGSAPYDAAAAAAAANNIATLARLDDSAMWPAGSDNFSTEGTRAMPELWDDMADLRQKGMALAEAADAMAAVAGNGLDALRAAMGPLGGTCSACHKAYREPR